MTDSSSAPTITAVIATRDRGDSVLRPLCGILKNDHPSFEIIVVDQSADNRTEMALQPFLHSAPVCYIRTSTRGASAGRNIGIASARSELIAITDDDCEVPANWLRELATAFTIDEKIGIVFGNIVAVPHDRSTGFVVSYVRNEPLLARSLREKHLVEGTSACMGLKRKTWRVLGGFDELLTVGAPLKGAEDTDLSIRALLADYFIYHTPRLTVVNHSFFLWREVGMVNHRYLYGNGAMFAKLLKCKRWSALSLLARLAGKGFSGSSSVYRGERRQIWLKTTSFMRGFLAGAITPVDRARGRFIRPGKESASRPPTAA